MGVDNVNAVWQGLFLVLSQDDFVNHIVRNLDSILWHGFLVLITTKKHIPLSFSFLLYFQMTGSKNSPSEAWEHRWLKSSSKSSHDAQRTHMRSLFPNHEAMHSRDQLVVKEHKEGKNCPDRAMKDVKWISATDCLQVPQHLSLPKNLVKSERFLPNIKWWDTSFRDSISRPVLSKPTRMTLTWKMTWEKQERKFKNQIKFNSIRNKRRKDNYFFNSISDSKKSV